MTEIERLIALEDIFRLKGRRDRALDTRDWDTYCALHVPDHVSENEGEDPRRGAKENTDWVAKFLEGILTVHHSHTPEIVFDSPTTACGTWGMEDLLFDEQSKRQLLHGFGFYHERYEKRDGEWLFCWRQLRRTLVLDYRQPTGS
ncbi:MAG: nuclear transport factor 2 family protein [Novosphingobium sp.]|nr:nuclear transport factor 2 family protein [Novosphingobium sp.]